MGGLIGEIKSRAESFMTADSYPGHDYTHVMRVYNLARRIGKEEGADMAILEPAVLLHDLGRADETRDKSVKHAERSVVHAEKILREVDYPEELRAQILHSIRYHSWNHSGKAITPEHRILQDADKMDAIGAIGIMRCFIFGGACNRQGYDPEDPLCKNKAGLEDDQYTVDHFYRKLFKLKDLMHTESARRIALEREKFMVSFLSAMEKEINGER